MSPTPFLSNDCSIQLFSGAESRRLSKKFAMTLPKAVAQSVKDDHFYLVPGYLPGTLTMYRGEEFRKIAGCLGDDIISDKEGETVTFRQVFYSMASKLEVDARRRIEFPQRILERAFGSITQDVTLIGMGNSFCIKNGKSIPEEVARRIRTFTATRVLSRASLASPEQHDVHVEHMTDIVASVRADVARGRLSLWGLSPRAFEEFVAALLRNAGYDVHLTQATRDGGYDIIAVISPRQGIDSRILVECKRYAPSRPVGIDVVRQLVGTMTLSSRRVDHGIIATTSYLSLEAESVIAQDRLRKFRLSKLDHNEFMYAMGFDIGPAGLWIQDGALETHLAADDSASMNSPAGNS